MNVSQHHRNRLTKIDHILGYRDVANKCKKAGIVNAVISDHSAIKIVIGSGTQKTKDTDPHEDLVKY